MAIETIQGGATVQVANGHGAETPAAGSAAAADAGKASVLEDVRYVKDVLAARQGGGLSDAELNALSHLVTQLSAAFVIEQSFSANVTSFEQLEKALDALEKLLQEVEKAKAEIKEGLKTIILTESLSAALGGLVSAQAFSTSIRQYRYNTFFNKARANLEGRSDGGLGFGGVQTPTQKTSYSAGSSMVQNMPASGSTRRLPRPADSQTAPSDMTRRSEPPRNENAARQSEPEPPANRNSESRAQREAQSSRPGDHRNPESQAGSEPSANESGARQSEPEAPPSQLQASNGTAASGANGNAAPPAETNDLEGQMQQFLGRLDGEVKPSGNPFRGGYADPIPLKVLSSAKNLGDLKSETVSRLGSYASTNAQKLGYRAEFEMMGARLVQQFAKSFSALGETQQSIANIDVNADTNVYSNQSEYWSVLMGTYQRMAQEYQTVFQHDLGALGEDASREDRIAENIYRV